MSLVERAQIVLRLAYQTEQLLEGQLDRLQDPQARAEEERYLADQLARTRRVAGRLQDELLALLGARGVAESRGVLGELVGDPLDSGQAEGGDVAGAGG